MTRLVYVADPMCSWCWGFAPVIGRLHDSGDYEIELIMGGLRAGETRGMTAQWRDYVQHHWRQVAEVTGQPFRFEGALPDGFVYETEPACRAVVSVREHQPAAALDYLHSIQQAFYAEARDVTSTQVLAELAVAQGMNEAAFLNAFTDEAMNIATATDFERKAQMGVMGFPSLLVDTGERLRMVSMGYQDFPTIQRQIERRLARDRADRTVP